MWRTLHLFDTWPGLIIPYMTFTLPLAIWTLSAFFREIPWDLDKAARVDGATPFQAFRKVIAPLAAPGVFTSAILVFIFAWNDFLFATSLTSTNRARTVPAAHRVLHRQLAVRLPGRLDRRGVGRRHHPDHRHGAGLPAPDRRRPDLRRGEGLEEAHHMAEIVLDKVTKRYGDGFEAVKEADFTIGDGEFFILVGPVGLREVDAAQHDRRPRGHHRRELRVGGEGRQRRRPQGPQHGDGLPELRHLSAHDRAGEHGVPAQAGQAARRTRSPARSTRRPSCSS